MSTPDHVVSPTGAAAVNARSWRPGNASSRAASPCSPLTATTRRRWSRSASAWTCHGRRSSTTSPGRKTSSSSGSNDYEPSSPRPSPRTTSTRSTRRAGSAARFVCSPTSTRTTRRPDVPWCAPGSAREARCSPTNRTHPSSWPTACAPDNEPATSPAASIPIVPPSSCSTRTSESSTGGSRRDRQLALGEQLTATLDLLLPAITRTSSVDTRRRRPRGDEHGTASE